MVAHQSTPPGHSSRFYPNLLVHKLRASSLVHSQAFHACLSNSCIASDNLNATCNFFFIIVDVRPERPIRLQLSCHIHFEWFFFYFAGCGCDERADGSRQHRRRLHRAPWRHDRLVHHCGRRVRLGKEDAAAGRERAYDITLLSVVQKTLSKVEGTKTTIPRPLIMFTWIASRS